MPNRNMADTITPNKNCPIPKTQRFFIAIFATLLICMSLSTTRSYAGNEQTNSAEICTSDSPCLIKAMRSFLIKRFYRRIEASDEQKKAISAVLDQQWTSAAPARKQMRQELLTLAGLMSSSNSSDDDISKQFNKIKDLRSQMIDQRFNSALKVRHLLKPEQREKIASCLTGVLNDLGKDEK